MMHRAQTPTVNWDEGACGNGLEDSQWSGQLGHREAVVAAGSPDAILTMWGDCRLIPITVRLILLSSRSIISWMCIAVGPCGGNMGTDPLLLIQLHFSSKTPGQVNFLLKPHSGSSLKSNLLSKKGKRSSQMNTCCYLGISKND